jgi:hypothetical protein
MCEPDTAAIEKIRISINAVKTFFIESPIDFLKRGGCRSFKIPNYNQMSRS